MFSRREFLKASGLLGLSLSLPLPYLANTLSEQVLWRSIPKSGEKIPAIGLGTSRVFHVDVSNKSEMQQRAAVLKNFFASGGGMIDSSPMYANAEEVIGLCLDELNKDKSEKSHIEKQMFSASKVWSVTEQAGIKEYKVSEQQWREDKFDLMQVHNLLNWQAHLETLKKYKQEGRIRYIGITTSHQRRHREFAELMRSRPELDFVQISYSLANRKAENVLLPLAQDKELAVIINRGFQTGYMFDLVAGKPLPDWAKEIQVSTWAQFFLKFIISHPAVTVVIPATSDPAHMLENMQAMHGKQPDQKMREEMVRYFESVAKG